MKRIFQLCCISIVLLITACKKDNYELPPETQTGAGTFGCKLDGKVWVPRGSDYNSGQNIVANYQLIYPSPTGYHFQLSASNYNIEPFAEFGIGADSLKIVEGKTYQIKNGIKGMASASYRIGLEAVNLYFVKSLLSGEIHFTKLDEINRIASGTFWFDASNIEGKIIHVTEGRFDVKYTR